MYKEHFLFEEPADDAIIWKYLDFDKFLNLIINKALYFCRSDKFEDPYEGTISAESIKQIKGFLEEVPFDNKQEMLEEMLNLLNTSRKLTLVNCWHINQFESDGMWKLYSNLKNAVAIQTTVGQLKKTFKHTADDIFIGKVVYVDFGTQLVQGLNAMGPFIYKRKSFEHENELRAVIWNIASPKSPENEIQEIELLKHGKSVAIDIEVLINKIYVSPLSDAWFTDILKDVLKKYSLNIDIISSNLFHIPEYLTLTNPDDTNTKTVKLPVEVLKAFLEKDNFRIKREEDERNRTIDQQINSFRERLSEIRQDIEDVKFKKLNGAQAISLYGAYFRKLTNLKKEINKPPFTNLYFILGKMDNLMIEINTSELSVKEKSIFIRDVFFLYSEKCALGFVPIAEYLSQINDDIEGDLLNIVDAFSKTVLKFMNTIMNLKV